MWLSGKRQTTDVVVGWQIVFVRERMKDIGNCLIPHLVRKGMIIVIIPIDTVKVIFKVCQ